MESPLAQAIGLAATGLFAGAALYTSLVDVPALNDTVEGGQDRDQALWWWRRMYPRTAAMEVPLAIVGSAYTIGYALCGDTFWTVSSAGVESDKDDRSAALVGGMLLASCLPYTLVAMSPVNKELSEEEALGQLAWWKAEKLSLWGKRHHLKAGAGLAAFGLVVASVVGSKAARTPR